jgi:predicted ATPase
MIKQLNITNFRCYEKSTITFNGTSILVGRNNAGKSTMIEALKIISSVTRKYKTMRFVSPPEWVGGEPNNGVSPNVENMNISDRGIFHMYGNPPAIVEALFANGTSIKAYVGEDLSIFAVIYDQDGCPARNSKEVKSIDIPIIEVLPQISAVLDTEKIIKKHTVDGNRSTRLASRNFRNQLFYYREAFPTFKSLVESTWERLRVSPVETTFVDDGQILQLYVRVQDFEAEIGWMGHGLQMWIQTMWFISQCPSNAIVVLDEPDVYMHADLQRRLVRLLSPMFSQLIIATHSLEIIEEVTSECIIPIDSSKRQIKPIGNESSLQSLTKQLGSPFNIDLARIFISNQFILWDGDDTARKILSAFQSVLYPQDLHPLINLPKSFINGWDDWDKVKMVADLFALNRMNMELFCILNSDYHSQSEIKLRQQEARKHKINLLVWEKKEIENYAINSDVILRYITHNKHQGTIDKDSLDRVIDSILNDMKEDVLTYSSGATNTNVEELRNDYKQPCDIVSGREFFNILSLWTQGEYGITISARQVVPYFRTEEVPREITMVISQVMGCN